MELQKQCKLGLLLDLQLFYMYSDCSDEEFFCGPQDFWTSIWKDGNKAPAGYFHNWIFPVAFM